MAEPLSLSMFVPLVGQGFRLEAHDGTVCPLELTEATALPRREGVPRQEPFSLIFRAPPDRPVGQGMARLVHEALGTLDIFLVPVGHDGRGRHLQALFN